MPEHKLQAGNYYIITKIQSVLIADNPEWLQLFCNTLKGKLLIYFISLQNSLPSNVTAQQGFFNAQSQNSNNLSTTQKQLRILIAAVKRWL